MVINTKELINEGIVRKANANIDMLIDTLVYYKTERLEEGLCPFGLYNDIEKPSHINCNDDPCNACDNYYRNKLRERLQKEYRIAVE